jgi:hypothetical protein
MGERDRKPPARNYQAIIGARGKHRLIVEYLSTVAGRGTIGIFDLRYQLF